MKRRQIRLLSTAVRWDHAGWAALLVLLTAGCGGGQSSANTANTVVRGADGSLQQHDDPDDRAEQRAALADSERSKSAITQAEKAIGAGEFERAKQICTNLLKREASHAKAHHYLGVALENLGDVGQARAHYAQALKADGQLTEAALNLSALLIDEGSYEQAVALLEKALKNSAKDTALVLNLGYARMGMRDYEGAEKAFRSALKLGDGADVRFGLAGAAVAQRRQSEALEHIGKAVELGGGQVQVLAMAAEMYRKANAARECISIYDKAIAYKPIAQFYANRGLCRQMLQDNKGARADFQKAVQTEPDYAPARYLFGMFLQNVDRNNKAAIEQFEVCAKLAPESHCARAAQNAKK